MDTKEETGLAAQVVCDVVEGLEAALKGWREMEARSAAEGLPVDIEAAKVSQAIDRARKLLA